MNAARQELPAADTPPLTTAATPQKPPRIDVVDWLRGLAVVLMFLAHGSDAWLRPDARAGTVYEVIRFLSGLPSRLFLLLVGVSLAIKYESRLARGASSALMRRETAVRGAEVLLFAYIFRLQEWVLSGFHGGWRTLLRVDILNCIGASMLVAAVVAVPRRGRPRYVLPLATAALFVGLGPYVGPAHFPDALPRAITSYFGGQRPMAWFTLFPFGAWALVGVVLGHIWLRTGKTARAQARTFALTFLAGALLTAVVVAVRRSGVELIRYPSEWAQQMGAGAFFYRLGILGMVAGIGYAANRFAGRRFSPMRQMGRTSLFLYWVHIELCYGYVAWRIRNRLGLAAGLALILALTMAMLGLSWLKTRTAERRSRALHALWGRLWTRRTGAGRSPPPAPFRP